VRVLYSNAELSAYLTEQLGPLPVNPSTPTAATHRATPGIVLVPTMGALHAGHASLIRQAASLAAQRGMLGAMATIFVNPTQFDNPADFERYPHTLEADLQHCRAAGAAAVFVPSVTDIYPPGTPPPVPPLPTEATAPRLEDAHRAGHFAGVCQAVLRLFDLTRPAAALFGEKDWQQLQVLSAMTRTHRPHISIYPGPTVREHDGLAMSSRNRFLSPPDRQRGLALSRALADASTQSTPATAERFMIETLAAEGITPDYAVVRDAQNLTAPTGDPSRPLRALIAAPFGAVRLLDNMAWMPAGAVGRPAAGARA